MALTGIIPTVLLFFQPSYFIGSDYLHIENFFGPLGGRRTSLKTQHLAGNEKR